MEADYFNYLRGVPYTVTEPCTDMGIKAWGRFDLAKRMAAEATVLGPESA